MTITTPSKSVWMAPTSHRHWPRTKDRCEGVSVSHWHLGMTAAMTQVSVPSIFWLSWSTLAWTILERVCPICGRGAKVPDPIAPLTPLRPEDRIESNLSKTKNIPPKAVIFSDFCCTFAMSLMILLVLICSAKVSEKSDMAKSWAARLCRLTQQELFVAQELRKIDKLKCCGI